MSRLRLLVLPALLMAAGCFPIELDVSKDGQLLIPREEGFFVFDPVAGKGRKVCGPEGGKPVFARFAPNGKEVLTVVKSTGGFNEFLFRIVPLAGGKGRDVFKGENTAYVLFAPDGSNLAIVKMSEKEDPKTKEKMPELHLVPVQGGAGKRIARQVGVLCRWFADSKRLLVFEISKSEEQRRFFGHLSILDTASGKSTPLAALAATREMFVDLSPDNKKALFTALRADKAGTNLEKGDEYTQKLFELDIATGVVRKIDKEARYAVYSPSGKKVLLGTPPSGFSLETLHLEIANADLSSPTPIATDAHMPLAIGGEGMIFPGWVNDQTVFYIVRRAVFGTEGKSLMLMIQGADGKGRKCVQPLIDSEAFKE